MIDHKATKHAKELRRAVEAQRGGKLDETRVSSHGADAVPGRRTLVEAVPSECSAADSSAFFERAVTEARAEAAKLDRAIALADPAAALCANGALQQHLRSARGHLANGLAHDENLRRELAVVERRVAGLLADALVMSSRAVRAGASGSWVLWDQEAAAWRAGRDRDRAADGAPHDREPGQEDAQDDAEPSEVASLALQGPAEPLPFRDRIQASFGRHDLTSVRAYHGGPARAGARQLGARAFATGDRIAFAEAPDLHTAAHEAAHVVQQRAGAAPDRIDQPGDEYERHADQVADAVVRGEPTEALLDHMVARGGRAASQAVVQRKVEGATTAATQSPAPPAQQAPGTVPAWGVVATPHVVRFPETEVGAVSPPCTVTLVNQATIPVVVEALEVILYGGTAEPALPGEFELIEGRGGHLRPAEMMSIQIVFRPARVVPHIGAHLRVRGHGAHDRVDVTLKAIPAPARADHADQRELSVAQHAARRLEVTEAPSVQRYSDMLAAVLAARALTDRAQPDDANAHARVARLLEPVAQRLSQLDDHRGRLAQFGAGNIAGQAALDMAESAVRSWLQLLALGARVRTEELVTRFRAGAEPIRFLTGEHADAPTLREFDHVSRLVGIAAAVPVLAPALVALAAEEAPLLAFAGRLVARRVALWALAHPAAALAAAEALLGFGLQIGEDGWESFWDQLRDPRGRWLILIQVLMDYVHVRSGMSGHGGADAQPSRARGSEPAPESSHAPGTDGARERVAKLKATLQQVHDAATTTSEPGPRTATTEPGKATDADHADHGKTAAARQPEVADRVSIVLPRGRGLPEYPVAKTSLEATNDGRGNYFAVVFTARTLDGETLQLAEAYVQLSEDGLPSDLPTLRLGASCRRNNQDYAVHIYEEVVPDQHGGVIPSARGERTSLTAYALDKFISRYKARFNHEPGGFFGTLVDSNRLNYQREYKMLVNNGVEEPIARIEAIKQISFGEHRIARGYSVFNVTLSGWSKVDLGPGLGVQKRVPTSIEVEARKP